eukprot:CAMPEP_0173246240 /NCGR_PEP_ID=MMETSP1142-20121109/17204_1 /TAXON_ID=483371 /ORGANISM="non described non described, Strain CCMP2298" /LENGTH=49 /DNA_ID=CAMNT_0014178435 /DNA_START=156 /DNA_END=305 /DNA_ORIENTATION=+
MYFWYSALTCFTLLRSACSGGSGGRATDWGSGACLDRPLRLGGEASSAG